MHISIEMMFKYLFLKSCLQFYVFSDIIEITGFLHGIYYIFVENSCILYKDFVTNANSQ